MRKIIKRIIAPQLSKKNIIWDIVLIFVFIVTSIIGEFCILQLNDTKLSVWANNLNDYMHNNHISETKAPIINLNNPSKKQYPDLFNSFYYTQGGHSIIYSFRQFYDGESFAIVNGIDYQTCINIQNNFTIYKNKDGYEEPGYYLDYGMFSTYYCDEILKDKSYLQPRFDAKSFIFISDSLANKIALDNGLLTEKEIETNDYASINEAYTRIITEKDYCELELNIDGKKTTKFSINNIILSGLRNGPRIQQLYGDFCLCYSGASSLSDISFSVELDLKNDIYENCRVVKLLNEFGYNSTNTSFIFKTFDEINGKYIERNDLLIQLKEIDLTSESSMLIILIVFDYLLLAIFVVIAFFIKESLFGEMFCELFVSLVFLSSYYVFIPPQFNVPLIVFFIIELCLIGYKIVHPMKEKQNEEIYTTIEI